MGYHPRREIVGQRFGRLYVIARFPNSVALCLCDCGKRTRIDIGHLDKQKSCGCWREEARRKHGFSKAPEYNTWEHIVQRCMNPKNDAYRNYGGRGITICQEWRESFTCFLRDMGFRPGPMFTIERIDNNGNYEPGNCKWIPKAQQSSNRRTNHILIFRGESKPIWQWAAELAIKETTIRTRLHRGWTPEQIFSLPPQRGKKPQ